MAEEFLDTKQQALDQLRKGAARYELPKAYYAGQHRLAFATDKFKNAFGLIFRGFRDNLCPPVIEAVSDRLELTGFQTEGAARRRTAARPGAKPQSDALGDAAWEIWQSNRMDLRAIEVHDECLVAGDSYVIVWPDRDGEPRFYPQKAEQMTVYYDEENLGVILWAAKCWRVGKRVRLTLYYPDRIEKFITTSNTDTIPDRATAFEPFQAMARDGVEPEPWPLPNPYERVPVFHFANGAAIGSFGLSELEDAIPIQDALNKAVLDMLVAMEFVALPQRWVAGIEVDIDGDTGKAKSPFTPGVDRIWTTGNENAKFGEFAQADLSKFTAVQDNFRMEIARITSTPLHFFMLNTNPPSGEALKALESRFTKKCQKRQIAFGNIWEDAIGFALRIAGRGGDDGKLASLWTHPAPQSEKEQTEALINKKNLGVSKRQCLRELDYTEEQINEMFEEAAADAEAAAEAALRSFDAGGGLNGPPPPSRPAAAGAGSTAPGARDTNPTAPAGSGGGGNNGRGSR